MTNITMNHKNRTIELTKAFYNASCKFGTEEYKMLQEARHDYPKYKVVTVKPKAKSTRDCYKGLDLGFIEMYIEKHDDEEHKTMATFKMLCAKDDESKEMNLKAESFLKIRAWFLEKYPEVEKFYKDAEETANDIQKKREDALKAKKEAELMARRAALLAKIA